jgi:hypothetical protein
MSAAAHKTRSKLPPTVNLQDRSSNNRLRQKAANFESDARSGTDRLAKAVAGLLTHQTWDCEITDFEGRFRFKKSDL